MLPVESQLTFRRNMSRPSSGSKIGAVLDICLKFVTCLAYCLTLKMEATCSSESSVDFQWTN
jgi:hypothetical protein